MIEWCIDKSRSSLPHGAEFRVTLDGLNNGEAGNVLALAHALHAMRLAEEEGIITPMHRSELARSIAAQLDTVSDGFWADTEHPSLG